MRRSMCMISTTVHIFLVVFLAHGAVASAERTYRMGDPVQVYIAPMTSLRTHIPLSYNAQRFPVCPLTHSETKRRPSNLGSVLLGEGLTESPLGRLSFGEDIKRTTMCTLSDIPPTHRERLLQAVLDEYVINMALDNNVPLTRSTPQLGGGIMRLLGAPVGVVVNGAAVVVTHLHLIVTYAPIDASHSQFRIIALDAHRVDSGDLSAENTSDLSWTYQVQWRQASVTAGERLSDGPLAESRNEVFVLSLVNSTIVLVALVSCIGSFIRRRGKVLVTNRIELMVFGELDLNSKWELVHNDVFRPPTGHAWLLAALVGAGSHLVAVLVAVLLAVQCGVIETNGGDIVTFLVTGLALLGFVPGYLTALILKSWGLAFASSSRWMPIIASVSIVPMTTFSVFSWVQIITHQSEPNAVTVFSIAVVGTLLALHTFIALPLAILGAAVGFHCSTISMVASNPIPRYIPPSSVWMAKLWVVFLVQGFLTFGTLQVPSYFLLSSFWQGSSFDNFGYLMCALFMCAATCAMISVLGCFVQLCSENYVWPWRSFVSGTSSGVVVFLYCAHYFFFKLRIAGGVATMNYFATMGLLCVLLSLMTGFVSFVACSLTVRALRTFIAVEEV
ncbi:endomembrane protein 70, putative [Bodo saltans]|uniref:Transmembrane 9 superfamily member n=1 Tax=Bodo saltans TaxID=75058 RepID=A0A0S4JWZ9_BODSA|nr:endomembrane protein 70, putative [Bodo saltans]|eukprot:CUG93114.1 endomembrane protein 70, putative [Bodo saltans]